MIEVRIDKKTREVRIVDEAEGTPGTSRQFTRFTEYCMPGLREDTGRLLDMLNENRDIDTDFTVYNFRLAEIKEQGDYFCLFWETTEK